MILIIDIKLVSYVESFLWWRWHHNILKHQSEIYSFKKKFNVSPLFYFSFVVNVIWLPLSFSFSKLISCQRRKTMYYRDNGEHWGRPDLRWVYKREVETIEEQLDLRASIKTNCLMKRLCWIYERGDWNVININPIPL